MVACALCGSAQSLLTWKTATASTRWLSPRRTVTTEEWIEALQKDPTLAAQLDDLVRKVSKRDLTQRSQGARMAVAQICAFLTEKAYELQGMSHEKSLVMRNIVDMIRKEGKYLQRIMDKVKAQ